MTTLTNFSPSTMTSRGLAALRTKQDQFVLRWQRARAQRAEVFRITQELADCSDRQLADLGLCRSDIPAVARGTYRRA
jgi:uncharacterized protein YjiS (DUF1127 family)